MKIKFAALSGLIAALLLACGPVFAHHAWGNYDMSNTTTVKGTVVSFDFGNPHVWIGFEAKDEKGNLERWDAGGPSPNRMEGTGWSQSTLKPGDQITAVGNRIKDGSRKLRLAKVILSDGKELLCYGTRYGS